MKFVSLIARPKIEITSLVYRILVAASLFYVHGLRKIINFDTDITSFPDPLGLGRTLTLYVAIFATLVCPILIAFGFLTRVACIIVLCLTLSGLLLVHLHSPAEVMDTPYIYSVSVTMILLLGPGKYSIDHWITNQKQL